MKVFAFLLFTFYFLLCIACRPAAAPVSISNKPISINEIPTTNAPLPPSKPLPEMRWTKFDGATNADGADQKLAELKGKVVILDFWATYCPPCLEEIPHLNELQTKYNSQGLEVVGLHSGGEDDRPKVPEFVEKLKINYTLGTPESALESLVFANESSIPQTLVFDRSGKLVERFVGYDLKIKNDLDKAVERALAK